METNNTNTNITKPQIYNLIILDESGSMSHMQQQTVSGCNETLNSIRSIQQQYADTQQHFVSIYAFQSSGSVPSRYLIKNEPVNRVTDVTPDDYRPFGCTPLYDAIGATLADLKATTARSQDAIGSVTIITDGYENASKLYSHDQVSQMISALKELGWNFSFIGANIDVDYTARSLNIHNSMTFTQDKEGMNRMFARERSSRMAYSARLDEANMEMMKECSIQCDITPEILEQLKERRLKARKKASEGYFDA